MRDVRHERTGVPVRRSRSGALDSRPVRTGDEPVTARSALRLRQLLSAVFLPVFTVATAAFALWAARSGPGDSPGTDPLAALAAVCGILALGAALDLVVVTARRRREQGVRR